MMKRIFFFGIVAATILVALAASPSYAQWYPAAGHVKIPNGDPVVGIEVNFYSANFVWMGHAYTNSNGVWDFSFGNCNMLVYARVWTVQHWAIIQCSGTTNFPDLVLPCGGPKQPPCPEQ